MNKGHFSRRTNHHPSHQNHQFLSQATHSPPIHSDYERKLIDEVIYLHSLWHRGPPTPSSHFNHPRLRPTTTTQFKQNKNKTPHPRRHASDKDWSVSDTFPPQEESGWTAAAQPQKNPVSRPDAARERARVMGVKIQMKGVESCSCLFRRGNDDDDSSVDEENDGDDDEEMEFFEKLFGEDDELKGFYEKNCEGSIGGEFYCLVCEAIGFELGRKYKNCVALVNHSMAVSKTKKKRAHRTYGNVICKVLGWDVDRLPALSPSVGEGSCQSPEKTSEGRGKNHTDEYSAVVEMEMGAAKQKQTETETVSDVVEKDNVTRIDAGWIASELTHGEGEVKNQYDENNTAVEMEEDAKKASQRKAEPEDIRNSIEKDNVGNRDAGSSYFHPHLRPTTTTQFKKNKNKTPHSRRHVSDKDWSMPDTCQPQDNPGWTAASQPDNNLISRPDPARERARVMGVKIQMKGVESCSCLFRWGNDNDSSDEEDDEEDDGDDEEEFELFEKLFEEDEELRGFYEKNWRGGIGGEFYCLVCGAIRNELGRKYKNCVALVNHSMAVSKTKKKRAHRAYGNVICKVLGWDIDRQPALPPSVREASCHSPEKTSEGKRKNNTDEDSAVVEMEIGAAKQKQTETETVSDVAEKDNVTSIDAGWIASELTHGEGEVKNKYDENNTAVEMEEDTTNVSQRQAEPEETPSSIVKDDVASRDAGCIASVLTHSEIARKGSDGCEVDNHDSKIDRICIKSKNAVSHQENVPKLDQETVLHKMGEECSIGSKPIDSGLPLVVDDPYEQLPCLPGEFQIPEILFRGY